MARVQTVSRPIIANVKGDLIVAQEAVDGRIVGSLGDKTPFVEYVEYVFGHYSLGCKWFKLWPGSEAPNRP